MQKVLILFFYALILIVTLMADLIVRTETTAEPVLWVLTLNMYGITWT